MGIFLTKNLHFCGSIIQWAIFNLSKLAGECIKKLFFNFRGISTSEKIAKNEKLQQNWFLILPLAESNSSRYIFKTIHDRSHLLNYYK